MNNRQPPDIIPFVDVNAEHVTQNIAAIEKLLKLAPDSLNDALLNGRDLAAFKVDLNPAFAVLMIAVGDDPTSPETKKRVNNYLRAKKEDLVAAQTVDIARAKQLFMSADCNVGNDVLRLDNLKRNFAIGMMRAAFYAASHWDNFTDKSKPEYAKGFSAIFGDFARIEEYEDAVEDKNRARLLPGSAEDYAKFLSQNDKDKHKYRVHLKLDAIETYAKYSLAQIEKKFAGSLELTKDAGKKGEDVRRFFLGGYLHQVLDELNIRRKVENGETADWTEVMVEAKELSQNKFSFSSRAKELEARTNLAAKNIPTLLTDLSESDDTRFKAFMAFTMDDVERFEDLQNATQQAAPPKRELTFREKYPVGSKVIAGFLIAGGVVITAGLVVGAFFAAGPLGGF